MLAHVTLVARDLFSGMCVRFSHQIGFLDINKHVCKQICPVGLQGQKDWIHVPLKPLVGVRRGSTPVLLWDSFV